MPFVQSILEPCQLFTQNHNPKQVTYFYLQQIIMHILPYLLTTPSMLWYLCQRSKGQCKAMGKPTTWVALQFVKIDNLYYCHMIVGHQFKRCLFQEQLQFQITIFQHCNLIHDLLNDEILLTIMITMKKKVQMLMSQRYCIIVCSQFNFAFLYLCHT